MATLPNRTPYIGITGVMPTDPVDKIVALLPGRPDRGPEPFKNPGHKLMLGILVSEKTLNGLGNHWPHRYPAISGISNLLVDDDRVLNLIHYNTRHGNLARQLIEVHLRSGLPERLDGFQLNIPWPAPIGILDYLSWADTHLDGGRNSQYIVLQVGEGALEQIGHDPVELMGRLTAYHGMIDYVLLDPSGGLGKGQGADFFRPYLDELYANPKRDYGIGVAGGFGPLGESNLDVLTELAAEYPYLSCDAEGRIRDENDDLCPVKALQYLSDCISIFRAFEH